MTLSALAALPARLDPGNDEARAWLRQELSDPAYRDTRDPLQRALDAFGRWLSDLLSGVHGPSTPLPSVVAGLVAVLLLVLGIVALRYVRRTARRADDSPLPVLGTEALTAAEYRARATRALEEGGYAACVLDAVRAVAAGAVERTLLQDAPSLTAREIAARLGPVFPQHATGLRSAADLFDAVAYGEQPASRQEAEELLRLERSVSATRPVRVEPEPAGAVVLP
ncbi:DUF4129 domain-containing protein [Pedococcus sp. NPDC057267]|uniref:DUF4129 domain-containing protein n=1 Tax=Pedococcus sp. NPDC057267 TaxID=3346077 RepID=UPI003625CB65